MQERQQAKPDAGVETVAMGSTKVAASGGERHVFFSFHEKGELSC